MAHPVPPVPTDEAERIRELHRCRILDTEPEPTFDDVTKLAAWICGTPMAVIAMVDSKRQWFKSKVGIELSETPRDMAFCAHTIALSEPFVVKDTNLDPRFVHNPLVQSSPKVRFYAGVPLRMHGGHALGSLAVMDRVPRDLDSEQMKALQVLAKQVVAQLELRRSAFECLEAFRAIIHATPLAIIGLDMQGRVKVWNRSAEEMFGWTEAEVLDNVTPIVPADEKTSFDEVMNSVRQGKVLRNLETRRLRKDGTRIDVCIHAAPVRSEAGEVIAAGEVVEDITQRKRQEQQIERSISLLRATLEATADGILAVDREGKIILSNRKLAELWGAPPGLFESGDTNRVVEFAASQLRDPEYFLEKIRRYLSGALFEESDTLRFKDGRLLERFSQPQVVGGETVGRVFSYRDITRRTHLEEQLRQAQKMEAVGQLAGGIAHDFNNVLNIIVGYTALLQTRLADDESLRGHADQIMKAADRAAGLTRQLLVFSRKQVLEAKVVDLNTLVSNFSKMLPRLIGEDIELVLNLGSDTDRILADAGQVEQVLMNLVINARDAMPTGGQLTIETANVDLDFTPETAGQTRHVMLSVTDNGHGMSEEVKAHIFEPFFTTKEAGKGTGLGLATVYAIVHQSGGRVEVQSELGKGSTFRVYLPSLGNGDTQETAESEPDVAASGEETILVVEDEPSLRELMREILERRGYKVLEASDGLEALQRVTEYPEPIDLVITDVVMPGMRGWEVCEKLRRLRPELKVIYISGYTDDPMLDRRLMGDRAAFVQKPFTPDVLTRKVRDVLDGTRLMPDFPKR